MIRRLRQRWSEAGHGALFLAPAVGIIYLCTMLAIVLGSRPEAMSLNDAGRFAGPDNFLSVEITVVEPLGEKMNVYAATAKHPQIIARVDAHEALAAGQQVRFYLDIQKVYIFARGETGRSLLI